jgi:hypothetical protein
MSIANFFRTLRMAGVHGAVLEACVLCSIDHRSFQTYLLVIGMLIRPPLEIHEPSVGR